MRECAKCKESCPEDYFVSDRARVCSVCRLEALKAKQKRRRVRKSKELSEKTRDWQAKNRDKWNAYQSRYKQQKYTTDPKAKERFVGVVHKAYRRKSYGPYAEAHNVLESLEKELGKQGGAK